MFTLPSFRPFSRLLAPLLALVCLLQFSLSQRVDCASHVETVSVIEPSCHARGLHGHSSVCGGDPKSERMPAFCRASSRTYELGILHVKFHNATALITQPAGPLGGQPSRTWSAEELGRVLEVHCDAHANQVDSQTGLALPPMPVRFRALPTGPSTLSTAAPVRRAQVQDGLTLGDDQAVTQEGSLDVSLSADMSIASRACASGLCCLGTRDWHGGPVFILPGAFPHSDTSPGLFVNSLKHVSTPSQPGYDLKIALVLSASTLTHSQKFLSPEALQSCRVVTLPPSRQTVFPPLRLLTERPKLSAVASGQRSKPLLRPAPGLVQCHTKDSPSRGNMEDIDEDFVTDLVEEHALVIAASDMDALFDDSNSAGSSQDGLDSSDISQAIPGSVSFLQVDAFQKFVATSVKATMNPMLHILQDMTSLDTATTMTSQVRAALLERVPKQVVFLTRDPIRRNITNQVVDSTAIVLNRVLHKSLPLTLTPYIADHVAKWTPPMVLKHLEPVLEDALTFDLVRIIPPILNRALPLSLEYSLNRAITHAVVPAVSAALSRSTTAGHYCYLCYYHNKACYLCNASPESQYYLAYYSTYFSDYYSDYYTPYYFGAINKVVNRDNPDVLPESTGFADKKGNIWPKPSEAAE